MKLFNFNFRKQKEKDMTNQNRNIPPVDLVIVIDTSPSIKDEAQALSNAAKSAIAKAKSSCPSDLRVVWFGIEGIWKQTKFDQTIRTYLTQRCKVSESQLRGRKRGELAAAGAQEDAARAIEDISDYFDWREGAARAIFYLGDEALEGGGDKTEEKDIAAANLAIQKAETAKVTVHTYFGTSNSKHQESIKKEYARVANETGGQYFTSKDAIGGFSEVLEKVICGSRTPKTTKLKAGVIYVQDSVSNKLSKLYTLDLATGKATFVGEIATEVSDIAFVGSQLYGLDQVDDKTQLIKIDINTGDTTVVGDIGNTCTGLAYHQKKNILYATTAKQLIAINLETGKGTQVVTVADNKYNCGEVTFDADGKAYISLIGYDKKKLLASCDINTGKVNIIGDTGFPGLASMEFVGNVLYGVTGNFFNLGKDGQLIRIDTTTGKGTLVSTTEPSSRWAGISIYELAREVTTEEVQTTIPQTASQVTPAASQTTQKEKVVSQVTDIQKEKEMSLLTIDTKNNCYVIDPGQMNHLQQNVANSFSLDKGTYDIKITSGVYKHAKTQTEGEAFVLLWIYGTDGSTFVNQDTGYETGATWTTLNGYNDTLKVEVKEKAVVCGLFFDVNNTQNSGSVQLSITSNQQSFNPQELTIDSKKNIYLLDENYLSTLKQSNANFIDLEPGNYSIKIREGNASYWSDNKKFKLEPWALLWIKSGKFITKLAGVEIEESWCSLNGLKDEIVLEVKEKTTLTGLFFDTYKEDNEGQIILVVEPVSATEINNQYQKQQQQIQAASVSTSGSTDIVSTSGSTGIVSTGGTAGISTSGSREIVSTSSTGGVGTQSIGTNADFTFRFDEAQMEQMWQQMAAKIETSVTVTSEQDDKKEAYWENLEKWILKGYQTQAKSLAMQVARVEFMTKALTQQMEVNFNQNFQAWSGYFDKRLNELIDTRITTMVDQQVSLKIANQTQEIKNLVLGQMQTDVDQRIDNVVNLKVANQSQEIKNQVLGQMQTDIDQRVDNVVNIKIANQTQEINRLVVQQLQTDIDQRIDNVVNIKTAQQTQEINNLVVQQLQTDVDQRIDSMVNLKIADQTQNVKNLVVQQMQSDIEQRIDSMVNLKIANQTQEINNLVVQQLQTDIDQRIDSVVNLKIANQSQSVKNLVVQQMQSDIDQRINSVVNQSTNNNVQVVVNNVISDIDNRINANFDNKILNFRDDVTSLVRNEISQNFTESIKTTIFSDIKKQQFFLDMQSIKTEVENFYARLGQFETQLNLRINQGDTQLYNWTLEQLVALQGCLTDRQALVELFESFSTRLKNELDNAPCVQPSRFIPLAAGSVQPQLSPSQPPQLPEGK